MSFNIRTEIQKHETEQHLFEKTDKSFVLPTKQEFIEHCFSSEADKRNRLFEEMLLLHFKKKNEYKISIVIWEVLCSQKNQYEFFGYKSYKSGSLEFGTALQLVSGTISFDENGNCNCAILNVMKGFHK